MLKKIVSGVISAGVACAIFATDARVETMGNSDHFFRDEISIYGNAANMGLYDKIMYGSYGSIARNNESWTNGIDWRPESPLFGGVISFGQKEGALSKFSVGATFNRLDSTLTNYLSLLNFGPSTYYYPSSGGITYGITDRNGKVLGLATDKNGNIDFKGKIDVMFAQTLDNGTTIGLGAYVAFQDRSQRDIDAIGDNTASYAGDELKNRFVKGNIGVNTPIGDGVDLEASVAISAITLRGALQNPLGPDKRFSYIADNDIGVQIDVRMFADLASINGAFVPHIQANIINYDCGKENIFDINAGLGLNVNIDRGFFWTGFEGLYNKKSRVLLEYGPDQGVGERKDTYGKKDVIGGKVGFGIERNVLTDWFVIRVGGSKLLAKESKNNDNRGYRLIETEDSDHVSLGMGVNVEERLKIDFTVAQNLPYTFTGLFSSGGNPYLVSRVSAVFSF